MNKEAFKAALKGLGEAIKRNPGAAGTIGGSLVGGVAGGYSASKNNKEHHSFGKKLKRVTRGVAGGAFTGGLIGNLAASPWQMQEDLRRYRTSRRSSGPSGEARSRPVKDPGTPAWLKGVKTKTDAKVKFREQAKIHHPDRGGSEERMKQINSEWDAYQKHGFNKLSFVMPSFFSELREIYRD